MKITTKKQAQIEIQKMQGWDLRNYNFTKKAVSEIENIYILNKLFKEYKKETNISMVKKIKGEMVGLSLILLLYFISTIIVALYGNSFLKLWFAVPLAAILPGFVFYFMHKYYESGKDTLINCLSREEAVIPEKRIVTNILRRLPFDNEKEIIMESVNVNKEQEKSPVKKRRL